MKIANIVSQSTIDVPDGFNVVSSINEIIDGLPTLIVGYDYVNKNYPNFDIGNIALETNLYWTFKKTEKRDKHTDDLLWFIDKVIKDLVKNIDYIFVDPLQYNPKTLIKIVRKIYSLKNKVIYFTGNVGYIYGQNLIFGIDLKLLEFVGFNIDKLKIKLNRICEVIITDESTANLKKDYKNLPIKYIPYLYQLNCN